MEELQHRRFVNSAFKVPIDGDYRPFNIPAGSQIFVVTADIQSGRNVVRITVKDRKGYITVDRAILLRSTRQ
jgi:hypothetical protein